MRTSDAPVRAENAQVRENDAQPHETDAQGRANEAQVREKNAQGRVGKVINMPRACARGLDVDGFYLSCKRTPLRPRVRAREALLCSWREAVEATDYALEHFGSPERDRGKCIAEARRKLADAGLGRLITVLDQIVENGRNRQESICNLAVKRRIPKASAERFYDRGG